ncbi:MAG TPA: sigma-70 family RNA polymerase sigma factor [Blastocatellia bacterium]|nr:sigma-70 family RNA polymerase sigma factor [Blastocatellia bacterium]
MSADLNPEKLPDEILVGLAILGDLRSFDVLALRYRNAVFRVAQLYGNAELAEDIVQEALLIAFKALPTIEDPTKFASWLYAITRHAAMRMSKVESAKNQNRVDLDDLLLAQSTALARPFADESTFETAWVRAAIAELSEDYRLILQLRFYDEMSLKRIAKFLALPLSTVKWRLHRAKQLLKEKLEPIPAPTKRERVLQRR